MQRGGELLEPDQVGEGENVHATAMTSTESVCMTATLHPSQAAWRTLPSDPIGHAAARLFPRPGPTASAAPAANATANATGTNPGDCAAT